MKQRLGLAIVLFCLFPSLFAQQKNKQNSREDNASFMFTESQLGEDDESAQSTSALVTSNNDVYLSNVGYLFSPMRFRVRGYDSQYSDMYINGAWFNDAETGRFSYGLIGGMNDATRNKEGIGPFEINNFTFGAIGGATNINLRASQYAAGSKLTLSGANRNYILRGMFTHSTGLMKNGWAFTGSVGYRWGNNGNIEGINYNSLSYFLSAEKVFNERHSLSFATWGSPTERGQQMASTEEAYYLANSHYYNPNWGYQNGEKRNSRIVRQFEPSAVLSWDFKIDDTKKLTTSAGFKYSNYGKSALGWNGNAADPRPDYYKNMPSNVFDVWNEVPTNEQLQQFNALTDLWKNNKAFRQVDWDAMYLANKNANALGKEALYYVEERHNDQIAFNFNSVFNHQWNDRNSYVAGISFNTTKGMHYKKMKDLLGANLYIDVDKFAVRDHGANSTMAQNDLMNPNRRIGEGDKFGYDYNIFVNKENAWVRYQGNDGGSLHYFLGGQIGSTQIFRDGLMRNGRAPQKSLGSSGTAKFLEGGVKAGLNWAINGNHSFSLNAGYEERAPLAYNAFIAPRIKNDFVKDLKTERIFGGDLTYHFNTPWVMGRITGYYTRFQNQVEMDAFYNDSEARFTYLSMNNVEKEHWGVEAAATFKLTSNLSLTALATWSDMQYMNNPNAVMTYESESESSADRVYAKGMHGNGTPLSAYSLGLDYSINGWFFNLTGNYYHRVYIDFSSYRRLESVLQQVGGIGVDGNGNKVVNVPSQERFDGGFMLDASIGKFIRLRNGKSLSLNLNLTNITNNTDLRTGGFEQNRGDLKQDGTERSYKFSKNSKYFYAFPFNAFLNIGYRF
ncbi:TonB-dependent receptor [uncultured Bacteroides sp.]|uniref:TonB-dependent receptor n=1 Tax=uncultured Bacteroides sp. TaxID=162156 RepID=UPI0025F0CEE0|nr:TonB-dependent receptor [uncultured Bacteroides sp.]